MPLMFVKRYCREDLQMNRDVLYVFGDNLFRAGLGGQAGACRGEPNAVGIATKKRPGMADDDFFADKNLVQAINHSFDDWDRLKKHLREGGVVVWPMDGIGSGLSELPTRAPKIDAYFKNELKNLEIISKLS